MPSLSDGRWLQMHLPRPQISLQAQPCSHVAGGSQRELVRRGRSAGCRSAGSGVDRAQVVPRGVLARAPCFEAHSRSGSWRSQSYWRLKGRMARRIKYRHVCVPPMSHFEAFFDEGTRAARILRAACCDEGDARCLGELFYIALRQKFYRIRGR